MGAEAAPRQLSQRTLALFILLVVVAVSAAGWGFYKLAEKSVEQAARESLLFIDRLKGEQLGLWQRQQRNDAAFIVRNPVNDQNIAPFLEGTGRTEDRQAASDWMDAILKDSLYRSAALADTQGHARLWRGASELILTENERSNIVRVAQTRESWFDRIRPSIPTNRLHALFYVPLLRRSTESCLGVMVLETDPEDYLFPLLRTWPLPSRSGEVGLVQLDGNDVVVAGTQVSGTGTGMNTRYILAKSNSPAMMALGGRTGMVYAVDYRGKNVMAALRPVPGSDSALVTKVDRDEVLAPLRKTALLIAAGAAVLLTFFSLLLFAWLRRRESTFYRQLLDAELAQREQDKAILEQRQLFEWIFEQTLAGYWDWHLPDKRLVMSPHLKEMLGYADEEISNTQDAWQRLVHPDDLPKLLDSYDKHVQSHGQIPYSNEVRYLRKDGSVMWVICTGLVVEWDDAGRPLRMMGCHTDLTKRKRAEEALRDSEERFQTLAEAAFEGVYISEQSVIVDCNPYFADMFGGTREQIIGQKITDFMLPEEVDSIMEKMSADATYTIEAHARRVDGSVISVEARERTVMRGRKRLKLGALRDVTPQKRLEASLRESERKLRALFEAMSDMIAVLDREGRFIEVVPTNPDPASVVFKPSESQGKTLRDIFPADRVELFLDCVRRALDTNQTVRTEFSLIVRGREVWYESAITPLSAGTVLSVARDITESKEAEAALRASEAQYRALFEGGNDLVSLNALNEDGSNGLFIEVNGMVTALLGYSREEFLKLTPEDIRQPGSKPSITEIRALLQRSQHGVFEASLVAKDGRLVPVEVSASVLNLAQKRVVLAITRDLSERKRADAELRKLSKAVEQSPASVVVTDTHGRIEFVSPRFAEMTGYSRDEVLGRNPRLLRSGVHPREFYEQLWSTIREGKVWQGEICNRKKSGELYWEFDSVAPILDEHGGISHYVAVKTDITERRRLTESLRLSEAKLRSLFAAMTDVIFVMDRDGRYLEVAPSSPHLLYKPSDDVLGRTAHELFPAEQADFFVRHVRQALATHTPVVFDYSLTLNGKQVWFLATVSELSADSVIFVGRDVTAIKHAEVAARASETRFRALFSCSSDGIFLYQFKADQTPSRFLDVSDQACRMLGYSRAELLHLSPLNVRHPQVSKDFSAVYAELMEKRQCRYETQVISKTGQQIPVEVNSTLFELEGRSMVIASLRDITEYKKFEAELRHAKEVAELANRAKSDFLANMSHELRTPLNAVIGFSEVLADQTFGPVNPKQAHYIDNVLQAGRHLLSLINDILDLSKVEAGKMTVDLQPLALKEIVAQVLELSRHRAAKHGLSLTHSVPQELSVTADERMLKQILFNLVTNAVKFTPSGGKVFVSAEQSDGEVRVSVSDTGIGIKAQDQERVFKQFEQVDSSLSRKNEGTGLGLTLCRQFVQLHGGRIWVESEGEGCGSTFRFTLPALPVSAKNPTPRRRL